MGMKPRKKAKEAKRVEHDHPTVEKLFRCAEMLAPDPGTMAEAAAWFMAWALATLVESGNHDAAVDDIRNEILVKVCLLEVNEEQKKKMATWIAEGLRE